eukprot:TRINITY_DN94942_c0_g1_i1.p1 TRINITY_DN94942_c0_g1~~TRINITY_DN94942_c0_g1_i1.p1  ORF type:complete len:309 (+),score=48.07 TRINITY_DN94942_c0_g1_i1:131-1057(+)
MADVEPAQTMLRDKSCNENVRMHARRKNNKLEAACSSSLSSSSSGSHYSDSETSYSGQEQISSTPAVKSQKGRGKGRGGKGKKSKKLKKEENTMVSHAAPKGELKRKICDETRVPTAASSDEKHPSDGCKTLPPTRRNELKKRFSDVLGGSVDAVTVAEEIEEALHMRLAPGPAYMRQARALIFNLRGERCAEFRDAVLGRILPPELLATMHTEEMATPEQKTKRAKLRQECMEACESDWALRRSKEEELRGAFTCGKCGGNHTWYFQFQTRACDEPMEFFVMCRDCRHGWRHNDVSPDDIFRQIWDS